MRNRGWDDMDAEDRFDEADKRMMRLTDRRAYLAGRTVPQDWLDDYDTALMHAIRERARFEPEAQDIAEARRRQEYERMDIYGR